MCLGVVVRHAPLGLRIAAQIVRPHLSRLAQRSGTVALDNLQGRIDMSGRRCPACFARASHCGSNREAAFSRLAQRAGTLALDNLHGRIDMSGVVVPHASLGLRIAAQIVRPHLSRLAQRLGTVALDNLLGRIDASGHRRPACFAGASHCGSNVNQRER